MDSWIDGLLESITPGKNLPLTAVPSALRFLLSAFPISAFRRALPRPHRRNPGAPPQRPGQPSLRPDPRGDRVNVTNRPAPYAYPPADSRPLSYLPVDTLRQVRQDGTAMNESEKQFSFTRAASTPWEGAKK